MSRICWEGFAAKNHSWSICAQGICRALANKGHEVHMFSTNGNDKFPDDLKDNLIGFFDDKTKTIIGKYPGNDYDISLSYTAPHNIKRYAAHGKNKLAIWAYELKGSKNNPNSLPTGFAKQHQYCDMILPPSEFAKEVFIDGGIPSSKMQVVPHGLADTFFDSSREKLNLKTNKRVKILANFAQPHLRKNIPGLLETYGKAFSKDDDVCLIIKVVDKIPEQPFEVNFSTLFNQFKIKYKNHAEVLVLKDFIVDMDLLYRSCDIVFSMTFAECFFFPSLEGLACGLVNVVPRYGGMLDFCNDANSLLIDGKQGYAPPQANYWEAKRTNTWYIPNVDDAISKLRYAYENVDMLKRKFNCQASIKENYSWSKVSEQILSLCTK